MKNSNKKIILAVVLCSTILSSCSLFSKPEKKSEQTNESTKKVEQTTDSNKQSTIKKDKTTEVLIDSEIKKEDIAKIVKHGDHWHVFTKDGREKITYKDPNKLQNTSNLEMVSVVGKSRLKGQNVVAIKKHGDHWHVYLRNGGEYLTYEDPSAMFPHIKVGTYAGSHGDHRKHNNKRMDARTIAHEKQKIKQTIEKNDERVIKILKHGDHYHIYTSKGNEFVSYTDPRSLYPNAEYGQYVGTHANRKQMIEKIIREDRQKQTNRETSKKNLDKKNSDKLINDENLVKVEDNNKKHNIVKILKHGDHWHIYTKNGDEFITYEDPSSKYPDVAVGIYTGSHIQENKQQPQQPEKHNKEDIPEEKLPENQSDKPKDNESDKKEEKPTEKTREQKIQELKITKVLGKDGTVNEINRFDIVKILKHEDHYHIYDSNGNEAITYTNPQNLYPNAYFGNYEGSHNNSQTNDEFKWPENITKIVDHKDHWHLYRGDEEVAVVRVNPKDHYPNAEYIKDYIDVGNVEVEDNDVFNYDDIKPNKVEGIEAVLNDNLRNMTGYGKLTDGIAIMGTEDKQDNVFYWLHGDHYHALSIKDLVKMEKSGALKGYTAKDVVATLKYKFQHPQEDLTYKSDLNIEEIIEFLKSHYRINDPSRIFSIGQETVDIYTKDTTNSFHISQFEKKNGEIIFKGQLPQIPSDEELEKQEESEETVNETEETVGETEETVGEKENSEKTNENPVEDKKPEEKQEEKQQENKEENKKESSEEKQNLPTENNKETTEKNSENI
ncbi:MAG: hypothetical protein ACLTB0_01435 [Finegoldia magna]|uniref:hypothetical protein n=1 Tax=Finegoldia magna TaxID=1260 RepID=UPI000B91546C|nr:hypothetical protein [Finegoldia magna]MDU1010421.1 hypothetical protein [Finegoldia magna]MDU1086569.1 hypothetical protein [Finegoldia magna]OXZ40121.1 hypothetical protein B9N50_00780 [Finegoldia magna]